MSAVASFAACRMWMRTWLVLPLLALSIISAAMVSAQTKKAASPTNPANRGKANTKDAVTPPALPGFPPNLPRELRDGIERQLRDQLNDRETRRKQAAKDAEVWLRRSETASDDAIKSAALVIAGAKQVDALKLTEATKTLQRVTTEHPSGVWAIEARLFLCDLALEHELSLAKADKWLEPAQEWVKTVPRPASAGPKTAVSLTVPATGPNDPLPLQSLGPRLLDSSSSDDASPQPRPVELIAADVWLRVGLLEALRGNESRARVLFTIARSLGFDQQTALAAYANRVMTNPRQPPLPDPVKNGPAETAVLIRLALFIGDSLQPDRALRLWDAVQQLPPAKLSVPQRSFAHFQRGFTRFRLANPLQRDPKLIATDYEQAVKLYPQSEWADDALFLHGNVAWNLNQNADQAAQLWTRVLDEHPGSEHGPRAAYFRGVAQETAQRWDQAKTAFDDAKQRFPESPFNKLIDDHLKKVQAELARPKPNRKG